jgi:threonine/homoserine/homoserine lactone efflux protein
VIGLLIFSAVMLASCVFLIYFAVAQWRDSHQIRSRPGVEITELPPRTKLKEGKAKLFRIYSGDRFRLQERKRTGTQRP